MSRKKRKIRTPDKPIRQYPPGKGTIRKELIRKIKILDPATKAKPGWKVKWLEAELERVKPDVLTAAQTVEFDDAFKACCFSAGLTPNASQAAKWLKGEGKAYKVAVRAGLKPPKGHPSEA